MKCESDPVQIENRSCAHAVPVLPSYSRSDVGRKYGQDTADGRLERRLERENVGPLVQEEGFLQHERNQRLGLSRRESDDDADSQVVLIVCNLRSHNAADEEKRAREEEYWSTSDGKRDRHEDKVAETLCRQMPC